MTTIARRATAGPAVEQPLVSVVVSTRNHGAYLADTVRGVTAQDVDDIELLVVDNASPDRTEAVMDALLATPPRIPITYLRLDGDYGAAGGRNVGMAEARGRFIAFTDSDCIPTPEWLSGALAAFTDGVGVVQGRTLCASDRPPLLSHYIETLRFDGSFSTSNVVYRREAIGTQRFDPTCRYWEDTDLGWRVAGDGWTYTFADAALVHHQVVPQTASEWVRWPTRYANWPAKAAAYPGFRRTLFLGVWVRPLHLWFQVALLSLLASRRRRAALVLTVPYAVSFSRQRGLAGRAPVAKVALHLARDLVASVSCLAGSARYRSVVL